MNLDGEMKQRIRTLGDFAEPCRSLLGQALERELASAFLVCRPQSALHTPDGPQATLRVDLRLISAAKEGRFAESCPVWPLRRREDSVYSFVSVGRTQNCDVWIPDESVSKLHAMLREQEGGDFQIIDAGSRNQTLIGAEPVPRRGEGKPRALKSGVELSFGSVETVFLSAEDFRKVVLDVVGPTLP